MMKKVFSLMAVFFLLVLGGCKEEILLPEIVNGEDGISTIFAFDVLEPTDEHLNGGYAMLVGGDLNGNGTLDPDEVQATVPIWHGNDGINGTNGTNGLNGADGTLVTISEGGFWVLDGVVTEFQAIGTNGTNGTNGVDGKSPYIGDDGYWYYYNDVTNEYETTNIKAEGKDGIDGKDGLTPNIAFLTLDVDPTQEHTNGGILVTMVWDKDDDQDIDQDEILGMYTVWHGNDGANGTNGEDGDTPFINEDGYWQINEFVTVWQAQGPAGPQGPKGDTGDSGVDGFSPYVSEGGFWVFMVNGIIIESTIPATGEQGEVGPVGPMGPIGPQGIQGEQGATVGYTISTAENCSTGGYRVTIDTDPVQWFEVCDGAVGETGLTGFQYLARTTDKEAGCFNIEFGLDINRNDVLDDDEVQDLQTVEVCDGLSTLFVMSPKVDGCFTIYSGLDTNYNGILERGEVNPNNTREVCDGVSTLVEVDVDQEEGCVTVSYYYDDNYNGEIDEGDTFIDEYTICDGEQGPVGDDGNGSLVTISKTEVEGCVLVETWIDYNNNGEVDEEDELVDEATICDGEVGSAGPQGPAGPIGPEGPAGENGSSIMVTVSDKIDGCVTITFWEDTDSDGVADIELYDFEICDGVDGEDGETPDVDDIKVDICHKYYVGWKKKYKTLTLPLSAVPAHLDHGDTLGACDDK